MYSFVSVKAGPAGARGSTCLSVIVEASFLLVLIVVVAAQAKPVDDETRIFFGDENVDDATTIDDVSTIATTDEDVPSTTESMDTTLLPELVMTGELSELLNFLREFVSECSSSVTAKKNGSSVCDVQRYLSVIDGVEERVEACHKREATEATSTVVCKESYTAFLEETGQCEPLLQQSVCLEGSWLVLDPESDPQLPRAKCAPRSCREGELMHRGKCELVSDRSLCATGMTLRATEEGHGLCDCDSGHLYWPEEGICYRAFRRGPCNFGEQLLLNWTTGSAECTPNPCLADGYVQWGSTDRCYSLRTQGPCEDGILDVNATSLTIQCSSVQLNALFQMTMDNCGRGSRMDFLGRCRNVRIIQTSSGGSAAYRRPPAMGSLGGDSGESSRPCPAGTHRDFTGRCRRVMTLMSG